MWSATLTNLILVPSYLNFSTMSYIFDMAII